MGESIDAVAHPRKKAFVRGDIQDFLSYDMYLFLTQKAIFKAELTKSITPDHQTFSISAFPFFLTDIKGRLFFARIQSLHPHNPCSFSCISA